MWLRNIVHLQQSSIYQTAKSSWYRSGLSLGGWMTHNPNISPYFASFRKSSLLSLLKLVIWTNGRILSFTVWHKWPLEILQVQNIKRRRPNRQEKWEENKDSWLDVTCDLLFLCSVLKEPVIINHPIKTLLNSQVCFQGIWTLATGVTT